MLVEGREFLMLDVPVCWHFLKAHIEEYLPEFMPYFVHYI